MASIKSSKKDQADDNGLPEMRLNEMIGKEPYPSVHGLKERPEVDGLLNPGSGAPQTVFSTDADTIPEMRINEMVGHDNYPSIHGVKEKLGK